jgi:hypothetical protein
MVQERPDRHDRTMTTSTPPTPSASSAASPFRPTFGAPAVPLPPPATLVAPLPAVAPIGLLEREPLAGAIRHARLAGVDPVTFARQLRDAGWTDALAQAAADRVVEQERRRGAWFAWYGGLGIMVAASSAAGHVALRAGEVGTMGIGSGSAIATLVTTALVATPIAAWGRWQLRGVDDGPGRWSPTRRALVELMLWVTAVVAIVRALVYVSAILRSLLVPGAASLSAWSFAQVLVTVVAAGGLFRFGWHERAIVRTAEGS